MTKLKMPQSADEIERFKALARVKKTVAAATAQARAAGDPLNITGHAKGKLPKRVLAADPVEQVGHIHRRVTAMNRLRGKNKLDARQTQAAESYRDAFELVHSGLGGSMDFDRIRGGGGYSGPAEAVLIASQMLQGAKGVVGGRAVIVIEHVVCHGRGIEETTRLIYGYEDGQPTVSRDVNYVGRKLREALSDLARVWHPVRQQGDKVRGYSASLLDQVVGDAGLITMDIAPYVMR